MRYSGPPGGEASGRSAADGVRGSGEGRSWGRAASCPSGGLRPGLQVREVFWIKTDKVGIVVGGYGVMDG